MVSLLKRQLQNILADNLTTMKRFLSCAALVVLVACSHAILEGPAEMVMEDTEFEISSAGGEIELNFTPLFPWTAECEESWIKYTPQSGDLSTGETVLTIDVAANYGEKRVAMFLLSFETDTIKVTITQDAAEFIAGIVETEYTVSAEGEEIDIKFLPFSAWEASCNKDWVSLDSESGKVSTRKKTLTISVDKNEGKKERRAVVVIEFNDCEVEISIAQKAGVSGGSSNGDNPNDPDNPSNPDNPNDPDEPEKPSRPDASAGTEDVNKGADLGTTK